MNLLSENIYPESGYGKSSCRKYSSSERYMHHRISSKERYGFYGVTGSDLDGIVSQLRLTRGVEVAIFIYELETQSFKVSLRSNGRVDVSKVAVFFGGGGHTRAAGCDLQGSMYDVINNITAEIEKQLTEEENA